MKRTKIEFTCSLILFFCVVAALGQKPRDNEDTWTWIQLLKTNKCEIERVFGTSITQNKIAPFQTYETQSGKINVAYSLKSEYVKACKCVVGPNIALSIFFSPKEMLLSDLQFDLHGFQRDGSFSPREISYSNESKGVLIATELVNIEGKIIERVTAIQLHPPNHPK